LAGQPKLRGDTFRDLAATNLSYSLLEISGIWFLIGCSFLLLGRFSAGTGLILACLLLFPVVTCLQQALLTLLHDSWHGLLTPNRAINDLIGRYLLSYPSIKLWGRLKREHLDHHRHLGERESDPTFLLYGFELGEARGRPARFAFNRLGGRVLDTVWRAFTGHSRAHAASTEGYWGLKGDLWKELLSILVMQLLVAWAISVLASWWAYVILWCIPLFTSTALCNLIRTFAEHSAPGSDDVSPDDRLVSFRSSWLELAFIAPLHFNYHAEHHRYMGVPHYRLPELRRRLSDAGPLGFSIRESYWEVLRQHFLRRRSGSEI
jgi:fatty acid desaturase